jgi:hypothetical protein
MLLASTMEKVMPEVSIIARTQKKVNQLRASLPGLKSAIAEAKTDLGAVQAARQFISTYESITSYEERIDTARLAITQQINNVLG